MAAAVTLAITSVLVLSYVRIFSALSEPSPFTAAADQIPDGGQGTKLFFTLYFIMTGVHMFHLAVGIGLVVWMFVRARAGRISQRVLPIELVALYWNFVDVVWMFLWPMFYLMR